MFRGLWLVLVLAGCLTPTTTRSNTVPSLSEALPGRIVLSAPGLENRAEEYWSTWSRRLAIVGQTSHITFDEQTAVIDVARGDRESLLDTARVLVAPGSFAMDGNGGRVSLDGASILTIGRSHAGCRCRSFLVVSLGPGSLEDLAGVASSDSVWAERSVPSRIYLDGQPTTLEINRVRVLWGGSSGNPPQRIPIKAWMFVGEQVSDERAIALAVGGGALEGPVAVERIDLGVTQ